MSQKRGFIAPLRTALDNKYTARYTVSRIKHTAQRAILLVDTSHERTVILQFLLSL